jgi:ankyrin repeat protein
VKQYAFAEYAAQHWHYHYRQANSQCARQLSEMVGTFLTTYCTKERWLRLHRLDQIGQSGVDYRTVSKNYPSATYYASLLSQDEVLMFILSMSTEDVNEQGGLYGNPLQAASYRGHEKVVQVLLDNGADVNAQEGFFSHALQAASYRGHEKVVKVLFDNGADVNAQGGQHGNALQAASEGGHEKVVHILLDKGADVSLQGGYYGNALLAALGNGHIKVAQRGYDGNVFRNIFYGDEMVV